MLTHTDTKACLAISWRTESSHVFAMFCQAGVAAVPSVAIYRGGEQVWMKSVAPKAWKEVTDVVSTEEQTLSRAQ